MVILALSAMLSLAKLCAPSVAPETLLSVARAESGFDPWVVAVNGSPRRIYHPASAAAAAELAGKLIGAGKDVDLGIGQINSRNLQRLGLGVVAAFDPCRNLAASARVLQEGYAHAVALSGDEQLGLRTAFSLYNTGDASRGFRNGYVTRVTRAAAQLVPAIRIDGPPVAGEPLTERPASAVGRPKPPLQSLDVFARRPANAIAVF